MPNRSQVLMCFDRNVLHGAHVAASTSLRHSPDGIDFHFIVSGLNANDKSTLEKTLRAADHDFSARFHELDPSTFDRLPPLIDNKFNYARLFFDRFVKTDRLIYLDTDMIIKMNLKSAMTFSLNDYTIGVTGLTPVKNALEAAFYKSIGMAEDAYTFNSGLMIIDAAQWKRNQTLSRCLNFAEKYPQHLKSCDQTILNGIFHNRFAHAPSSWNEMCYPADPIARDTGVSIMHLVGAPKPWDLGASSLHAYFDIWNAESQKTALPWPRSPNLSWRRIYRSARLAKSFSRLIKLRADQKRR